MGQDIKTNTNAMPDGEVCTDAAAMRDKKRVVDQQWWGALFAGGTQVLTFIAGLMTAAGMGMVGEPLAKQGIKALTSGSTSIGLGFLAVAAVSTVAAVGFNLLAMRHNSSAWFDQSEANAQHNAKYIVQELKKEAACVQEFPQNCRADGRSWVKTVRPNMPQPELQAQQSLEA